ncbi:hypothetical protein EJ110_NYTH37740 [Nymphaea thermarum]|nr:hypothetical protein EJ110_NYTH37740 [Nymphaea thermarum]
MQILASFFPSIFRGLEEQLVLLLKDDNETIKEGILLVLAKASGAIRNQLPTLDRWVRGEQILALLLLALSNFGLTMEDQLEFRMK